MLYISISRSIMKYGHWYFLSGTDIKNYVIFTDRGLAAKLSLIFLSSLSTLTFFRFSVWINLISSIFFSDGICRYNIAFFGNKTKFTHLGRLNFIVVWVNNYFQCKTRMLKKNITFSSLRMLGISSTRLYKN